MASIVPNDTKKLILDRFISGRTFKMILLTSAHTPNKDTQTYYADISANEVSSSGTNYTAGGQELANVTTAVDDTNDLAYVTADDEVFTNLTATFRYAAVIDWTGNAATSPVVTQIDYVTDKAPYADDFTHEFAADGFLKQTE